MRKGWEIMKLGDLCLKITDGSHNPPKGVELSDYLMLSSRDIFDEQIHYENPRYLSKIDFENEDKRTAIKAKDVLLTIVGTIGRVAVVPDKFPNFTLQRSVAVLRPNQSYINSYFLKFSLQNNLDFLISESRGAAQKGIYLNQLKQIEIPIPSLSEQEEIVSILDDAFESIERAKSNAEQNLKNSIKLFDSYLKNIFENKGENWEIKKLREVCDIINGGTPDTSIPKFWDGENLWITPKDMGKLQSIFVDDTMRKITDEGLKNSSAKILPINSIILSSRAPIGHLAINVKPISTNQGCKGLVPSNKLDYLFLYYFLYKSVDLLNSLGTGATFKELSGKKLSDVEIPIPPLDVQKGIIKKLKELSVKTKKLESKYQQKLNDLEELKKSILQKGFNGELKTSKISA